MRTVKKLFIVFIFVVAFITVGYSLHNYKNKRLEEMRLSQSDGLRQDQNNVTEQLENQKEDLINLQGEDMDMTHENMEEKNSALKETTDNNGSESNASENNRNPVITPEEEVEKLNFQMESLKKHSIMHAEKMVEIGNQIRANVSENYDERVHEIVQKNYIHFRDELQIKNQEVFLYLDKQIQTLEEYKGRSTENIDSIREVVERHNQVLQRLIST